MPEGKKAGTRIFRINAQINAYLVKQLPVSSINSRQGPAEYDALTAAMVGSGMAETGKNRTTGTKPNFLKAAVVQKETATK